MDNFIQVYPNVIPKKICNYFINRFDEEDKMGKTYAGGAGNSIKKNIKDCQDFGIGYGDDNSIQEIVDYFKIVHDKFIDYVKYYTSSIDGFLYNTIIEENSDDTCFYPLHSALIHKYEPPNQGYHVWHQDWQTSDAKYATRMLVGMVYLNDVEEGGETEFYHQKLKIKPEQGTLVVWPSYFTHIHRGNKPISNAKYIINTWAHPLI